MKARYLHLGIILTIAFSLLSVQLYSATYYSIASAAWNVNSTWSTTGYGGDAAGAFPIAGDIVNIGNGKTVTVSANAACATLVIDATGVLVTSSTRTVSASASITINGTYTNQSTGAITTPTWTCNGTYNHASTSVVLPKGSTTTTWNVASNCNITRAFTSATVMTNFIGQTFGNFTFNPSSMTNTVCLYGASGTVTVQGNFTITQTGSSTLYLRQSGQAFVGVLNIYGNLTQSAGVFDIHNGGTVPTTSVINLKGNFTLSGTSTFKQTTVQSGSTVSFNFTGTGTQTVSISPTASITSQATTPSCAIKFTVASGATIDMGTSVLTGTNNTSFTLSAGATIITANTGGLSLSGATGSIQVAGPRTYSSTANYTYNSTVAGQVTGNAVTAANNLTISNTTSSGVTFSNAISVTGNMAVTTGAHADLGTYISSAASLTLGGVAQTSGTSYGGSNSSAANKPTTFFNAATTGLLNVSLSPPSNLSYNSPFGFRLNVAITQQNPTVTGVVTSYGIAPSLPTGLNFNTSTGAITGTPTANSPSTNYTVTASNSAGSTTCTVVISVGDYRYAVATGDWNSNSTWALTSGGTSGAAIPTSGDLVFIGEAATDWTVTIPTGYAAVCGSLTMGNYSDNTAATLTISGDGSLAVGNDLVMNRPNAAASSVINVSAGTLTVGGTLKLAFSDLTPDASATLVNRINISTGTVTTANLLFNGQAAAQSQIVFSDAGTLNISGDLTFGYILGILTPSTGTVNFNGTAAQTIPIGVSSVTYNNLTVNNTSAGGATINAAITVTNVTGNLSVGNITSGSTFDNGGYAITLASGKSLNVANGSTFKLSGTSTMVTVSGIGTKTFGATSTTNYCGSAQTVTAETYGHLTLSGSGTKTMPGTALSVAGNFNMSGTASATALAAINTTGSFTLGTGTAFSASTFTHTVGGNWTNDGTFTAGTSTINFNGSGAGNIGSSNFNNVTFSGSGTKTAAGTMIIGGNVTISHNFSGGSYVHSIAGNWTNSGTFTPGSSTVNFNGTGAQGINIGSSSFNNFTISNISGTCSATSNGITVSGIFTTAASTILDMATFALSVGSVDHAGTILTQYTSATPLTTGKTWGGLVNYNSASTAQTAMAGTYNNLTITTSGGATASGDITVNGVLNLAAANPSTTKGCLEMVTDYNGYPGSGVTNPIISHLLTMGSGATTTGQGDVTGKIYRSSLSTNTAYTFGNQFTTYSYTVAPTDVTVTVTIGTAYGQAGVWGDPNSVKRSYEMTPTGGTNARVAMNLHYLDDELNGNTPESNLVTGDYDIGGGAPLGDEHGRSSYDFSNNYIGLSGLPISYFIYDASTHPWRTVFTLHKYYTTHTVWDGSESSVWTTDLNWSNGKPGVSMIAIIPDAVTTPNDPILAANQIIGGMQILSGGILNMNGQTITVAGYNYNGWEDQSGLSNYSSSTVILTNTTIDGATITSIPISGIPNFYNLTINSAANVTANLDSHIYISGIFTKTGNFDAESFVNTIEYNGAAQSVVLPDGNNKYYNLTLSGSGLKTLPGALTLEGNFALSGTATVTPSATLTVTGTTILSGGTFTLGADDILSDNGAIQLNSGTFNTGGYNESAGTLNLTDNSTIALGTGDHTLTFADSRSVGWTSGKNLTITGWTGSYGGPATDGKITFGAGGLTTAQLNQIKFLISGTNYPAKMLASGEIVPASGNYIETGTISGLLFCPGTTGISIPFTYAFAADFTGTFTAQLSSSTGIWGSPTTLGTVDHDHSGSQSITSTTAIPEYAGTGYRIRVISDFPAINGSDNGSNLTVQMPTTATTGANQTIVSSLTCTTLGGNSAGGGETGTWTQTSGPGGVTFSPDVNNGGSTATVDTYGAYVFRWTISNGNCSSYQEITVTYYLSKISNADGSWYVDGKWTPSGAPTASEDVIVAHIINIDGSPTAVCNNLTINSGKVLTIDSGHALTVSGILDNNAGTTGLIIKSTSSAADGTGSLITNTSGADITVERYVGKDKWHLISSPVTGQSIYDFVTGPSHITNPNNLARNGTKYGLGQYPENEHHWVTYTESTIASAGNFNVAQGYEVLTTTDGKVSFAGTLTAAPASYSVTLGNVNPDPGWNLTGNPFPAFMSVNPLADTYNNFITENASKLNSSYVGPYYWDAATDQYVLINLSTVTAERLAPGQGFFVKVNGAGTINFSAAMRTNTPGTFKSGIKTWPEIAIKAETGGTSSKTMIKYIPDMTRGLDPGYDGGTFDKDPAYGVYTRLLEDNGINFQIQCLPDNDYENLVVPVGLNAAAGSDMIFRADVTNLPIGMKVYLEDRLKGTFTRMDETGSFYSVLLDAGSHGVGRFFIHTTQGSLGIKDLTLQAFKVIPMPDHQKIRILGPILPATASATVSASATATATIYDLTGRMISSEPLYNPAENEIPFTETKSGIYLIEIRSGLTAIRQKITWIR